MNNLDKYRRIFFEFSREEKLGGGEGEINVRA